LNSIYWGLNNKAVTIFQEYSKKQFWYQEVEKALNTRFDTAEKNGFEGFGGMQRDIISKLKQ